MHAMTSLSLRGILAAAAMMAAAPAAHAWTRISCDLSGTAATPAVQMRQYRTDGTELSQTTFRLTVKSADIPEGARADTDCTEFVNRDIDVTLDNTAPGQIRKGKPIKLHYRYDESLGQSLATKFELVR
ncbi:hypothetical protein LMG3431_06099 [Achromobacter pestifer]|uniref:Uncharacterized protein n=2 Tax=Achromobacter pestifer TaxID=1353889 RepID=A0A6S7A5X2_9BURK|nr:hypothetical protein LMG3431_06099 [Achromobacter pestifer]